MKTPALESLFNKVAGIKAYSFIKKRLQHRYFPVNIAKFLRTAKIKSRKKIIKVLGTNITNMRMNPDNRNTSLV